MQRRDLLLLAGRILRRRYDSLVRKVGRGAAPLGRWRRPIRVGRRLLAYRIGLAGGIHLLDPIGLVARLADPEGAGLLLVVRRRGVVLLRRGRLALLWLTLLGLTLLRLTLLRLSWPVRLLDLLGGLAGILLVRLRVDPVRLSLNPIRLRGRGTLRWGALRYRALG